MIRKFPMFTIIRASKIIFLVLKIPCSRLLNSARLLGSVEYMYARRVGKKIIPIGTNRTGI